ncbi:RagB/SusD family nutrient uptake outer membrane protein [Robertkochia solimangrovi]|uniref:RagB/SusD family nutrient uptake outer membrane protein n=1 Tax=Robertkochia solimangrovi TaxID=2213046 RepID=UPI0013A580EC|nr:RagB/SusD family nutrient uptake outer membrane protein [Robertkochia solimangrovi]
MRNIKILYISLLFLSGFSFQGCELAEELDDYEPLYALDAETAINNEETAELALTGIYATFRQKSSGGAFPEMFIIPDILSGKAQVSASYATRPEYAGWINNAPLEVNATNQGRIYAGLYDLVNRANWVIEKVGELSDEAFVTEGRREGIIGEARILRALADFYLLRNFGQFYDVNSEYGINLRDEPVRSETAMPRNTVSETYESILADLDAGIEMAPELRAKYYVNKTFARGLKARVLLYKGDYAAAAEVASQTIDLLTSDFQLESDYTSIFGDHESEAIFDTSEILFGTRGESNAGIGIGNYYSGFFAAITQSYIDEVSAIFTVNGQDITIDENRIPAIMNTNTSYGGYWTSKYTSYFSSGSYEIFIHMRIAEVYLILAESSARANNAVTPEALEALNAIRLRAGATPNGGDGFVTYPATIGYEDFLTAVRKEKLAELQAEGGESWYDLIRYDYTDGFGSGFQVVDEKPTATDPDKFIFPIPQESLDVAGGVVIQNPGY